MTETIRISSYRRLGDKHYEIYLSESIDTLSKYELKEKKNETK